MKVPKLRRRERVPRIPSDRNMRRKGRQAGGRASSASSAHPHEDLRQLLGLERHSVNHATLVGQETTSKLTRESTQYAVGMQVSEQEAEYSTKKAEATRAERARLSRPRFGPVIGATGMVSLTFLLTLVDVVLTRLGLTHLLLPPMAIQILTLGIGAAIVLAGDLLGILTGKLADESTPGNSAHTESVLRKGFFTVGGFLMALAVGFNLWRYHDFDKGISVPALAATITLFALQLLVVAIAWWLGLTFHESVEHRRLDGLAKQCDSDTNAARKAAKRHALKKAAAEQGIIAATEETERRIALYQGLCPQRGWAWVAGAADRCPNLSAAFHEQHEALWSQNNDRQPIVTATVAPPLQLSAMPNEGGTF